MDFDTVDELMEAATLFGDEVQAYLTDKISVAGSASLEGAAHKYKGDVSAYRKMLADCSPAEQLRKTEDGSTYQQPYQDNAILASGTGNSSKECASSRASHACPSGPARA